MKVELQLTTAEDARPIRNLWPLYLHEIAAYEPLPPNAHGVLSRDPEHRSWDDVVEANGAWWRNPELLFPHLIRVDGVPAGFNFVARGPYVPTPGSDVVQSEFFVAHAWRGTGVATEAFRLGLARFPGRWEVDTWPTAHRAQAFWRRTLPASIEGDVTETFEEDHPWGPRIVFRFESSAPPSP